MDGEHLPLTPSLGYLCIGCAPRDPLLIGTHDPSGDHSVRVTLRVTSTEESPRTTPRLLE